MSITYEELGVKNIDEARKRLKFKECRADMSYGVKDTISCNTNGPCPLNRGFRLNHVCFKKKCKLNRGRNNGNKT